MHWPAAKICAYSETSIYARPRDQRKICIYGGFAYIEVHRFSIYIAKLPNLGTNYNETTNIDFYLVGLGRYTSLCCLKQSNLGGIGVLPVNFRRPALLTARSSRPFAYTEVQNNGNFLVGTQICLAYKEVLHIRRLHI